MWLVRLILIALMGAISFGASAADTLHVLPMPVSSWQVLPPHPLACELSQEIPYYGRAVFMHHAGKKPAFKMETQLGSDIKSRGELYSRPPKWSAYTEDKFLSEVTVYPGHQIFKIGNEQTRQMLSELAAGWFPTFVHADISYGEGITETQLSAVNFKRAFGKYLACLQQLLPYGYDDVKRNLIYYGPGSDHLNYQDRQLLDRIVRYHEVDSEIQQIVIKGYSDSNGTRRENYLLAIKRLRNVEQYLLDKGIPEDKIDATAYGERFPAASNATAKGRAKNRRVTIQLLR